MHIHPEDNINVVEFVDELLNKMNFIEVEEDDG